MTNEGRTMPRGALIGSFIGFIAWVAALGVVIATTTDAATFWSIVPASLLGSVGLWALVVVAHDAARRRFGTGSSEALLVLFGGLLLAMGLLLLLGSVWILPVLRGHPDAVGLLESSGSSTSVPIWLPPVMMAVGLGVLAHPLRRMLMQA